MPLSEKTKHQEMKPKKDEERTIPTWPSGVLEIQICQIQTIITFRLHKITTNPKSSQMSTTNYWWFFA